MPTVLAAVNQLIFRDLGSFSQAKEKFHRSRNPRFAMSAVNPSVYIALDDPHRSYMLEDASGLPVHNFGQKLNPIPILFPVNSHIGGQGRGRYVIGQEAWGRRCWNGGHWGDRCRTLPAR